MKYFAFEIEDTVTWFSKFHACQLYGIIEARCYIESIQDDGPIVTYDIRLDQDSYVYLKSIYPCHPNIDESLLKRIDNE